MEFPPIAYMRWAKTRPRARIDLARSGVESCPASLLRLRPGDLATHHPAGYGWPPLLRALGRRYGVGADRVFTAPGGTSLANWLACATVLAGAGPKDEVIVERPTYEPLLRVVEGLGCRVRRLERRFDEAWAIDLDRFERLIGPRTRLAVVTNLHNPSGCRIPMTVLRRMAKALARARAVLLVDEVYLECLFGRRTESSVHAGANVLATNSLTKAYGLDGLRAGWVLGPPAVIEKMGGIYDHLGVNGVAAGERMALAALKHLPAIARRAHALLDPNLREMQRFLATEPRLRAHLPPGGNVIFLELPRGIDADRLAHRLHAAWSTAVVPGAFFESPGFVRVSFGCPTPDLRRGLANLSRALDEMGVRGAGRR